MPSKNPAPETAYYEVEVAAGIEDIASAELSQLRGLQLLSAKKQLAGALKFVYPGNLQKLLLLKTVIAVYSVQQHPVPRPKALLGHQYFHALIQQIQDALALNPAYPVQTLAINAAGSDSAVMLRLKQELATHLGLQPADDVGDCLIRIRQNPTKTAWETLVRLSPRPLSTRTWRVRDMPGALNAAIAHAMIGLSYPTQNDICLNIGCGSGTILIERWQYESCQHLIGCDVDPMALHSARENIQAAKGIESLRLLQTDGRSLPLPPASVDRLYADLPFGQLVGSHEENRYLYPALLAEAARVAQLGAIFTLITHEVRLMEQILENQSFWKTEHIRMVTLRGLHPRIFVLIRI
jgi:23S rRNA G2445 N2-methylase RlmL